MKINAAATSTAVASATASSCSSNDASLLDDACLPVLLSACQEHLSFLRAIHRTGITVHLSRKDEEDDEDRSDALFLTALQRYRDFWLPLVSKYPTIPLIPPLDVAWLWHAHRLAPLMYVKYCQKHYKNNILEATCPFTFQQEYRKEHRNYENRREAWVTRLLWKKEFPNEPFFAQENRSAHSEAPEAASADSRSSFFIDGYNLRSSVQAQAELLWHLSSGPQWEYTNFASQARERYKNFLKLAKHVSQTKQMLVPCYDIDWVWHTHILYSQKDYQHSCLKLCGRTFHHDDAFNDRQGNGPNSYQQAWKYTCELYQQVYQQPFDQVPGTLYYGPPAPVYWQYQSWDPVAPWTHNNQQRRRRWWSSWASQSETQEQLQQSRKDDEKDNKQTTITWRHLLITRGRDLWTVRQKAFLAHDDIGYVYIPTHLNNAKENPREGFWSKIIKNRSSNAPQMLKMVGMPSHFQHLENQQGLDKQPPPFNTAPALTQSTGEEWKRQRRCMAQEALAKVKKMSLHAVDQVEWYDLWQQHATACGFDTLSSSRLTDTIVVDLKDMVAKAVLAWSSGLFGGVIAQKYQDGKSENGSNVVRDNLKKDFWEFWQASRALRKDENDLQSTKKKLLASVKAVAADGNESEQNGLIHHVFRQDFTPDVASINCVHAMVAASDTTMVLVFWTLYHLAQRENSWHTCQQMTWSEEEIGVELEQLAELKAAATSGSPVDPSGLSLLGRALVESARAYPPVWSLPRTLPDGIPVQFDVPWANGILQDPKWNPDRQKTDLKSLATFGVGKRHCPGGTAALWSAHALLRRFILQYNPLVECETEKAHDSLYLGPTLCLEGPQYFELTTRVQNNA